MDAIDRKLRMRLGVLVAVLASVIVLCVGLAFATGRRASQTIGRLAHIELESASLARAFRDAVDDVHGALLRAGTEDGEDSAATITSRRAFLKRWIDDRLKGSRSQAERVVLAGLKGELDAYFHRLDSLPRGPDGSIVRLDRETAVAFDDASIRLQSLADDYDAVDDLGERALLTAALDSVRWQRDLVFMSLGLLAAATSAMGVLLYKDVVRPLKEQLVESEQLLARREKLAALGTLSAGVAHEIRNPLTAIKARLFTLRRMVDDEEAQEDVKAIASEIDRLEGIVRNVLGYARPSEPNLAPLDLAEWTRELARFLEPELTGRGVSLSVDAPATVRVEADAGQLRQVVLNLVRNAVDAFGGRAGRVELAVRQVREPLRKARQADVAVLSVKDDGPGIPLEIQPRLFDPFFTTKASGTGLGLAIVARLVEGHGGEIAFRTAPGAGTRFDVRLPAKPAAA